jgi:hypothetical protein
MTTTHHDWLTTQDPQAVAKALTKLTPDDLERGNNDPRFALWLKLVDRRMGRAIGLTHRDIGDWTWRDAFDDGVSPREAAFDALQADDTFGALFGGDPE